MGAGPGHRRFRNPAARTAARLRRSRAPPRHLAQEPAAPAFRLPQLVPVAAEEPRIHPTHPAALKAPPATRNTQRVLYAHNTYGDGELPTAEHHVTTHPNRV